jgi:3-hydroxy-9,10-secoandrosta-1,3,5(10)-triene-9,17-dione monooxygenase reductase component
MDSQHRERLAAPLGKLLSGLYILTAHGENGPIGMLASFIQQAGFAPPLISVALGRDRPMLDTLVGGAKLGVNILGRHNRDLLGAFIKPGNPFSTTALVENEHRLPQFASALAFLACRVTDQVPCGDHILIVAEVLDGALQRDDDHPMFRVRRNGFDY